MGFDPLGLAEEFKDSRGYHYVEVSEALKKMCLVLPDSKRVQVPPLYKQQNIHIRRPGDNFDIVIQAWKGDLLNPFTSMPGGIGAEVGIYRTDPARKIPKLLDLPGIEKVPAEIRPAVEKYASAIIKAATEALQAGVPLWWPFPELDVASSFKLIDPKRHDVLFTAHEPKGGYWNTRWMTIVSFEKYRVHELLHGHAIPAFAYNYKMEINVGPHHFRWNEPSSPFERFTPT